MENKLEDVVDFFSNNVEDLFENLKNFRVNLNIIKKQEYILSVVYVASRLENYIEELYENQKLPERFSISHNLVFENLLQEYYFSVAIYDLTEQSEDVDSDLCENIINIVSNQFSNESISSFMEKDLSFEITDENVWDKNIKESLIKKLLKKDDYVLYSLILLDSKLENKINSSKNKAKI